MKKLLLLKLTLFLTVVLMIVACKKNYITGGTSENVNMYKNMTTYDFLKSDPLYDTLIQVIDAAGLKDKINEQGVTFFAPSNHSIFFYLNQRTIVMQNVDPNAKFALDSLLYYITNNVNGTKDSLLMYLVHQPLPYSVLTNTGAIYPTELTGDSVIVSYEYTKDSQLGYNSVVSSVPQLVYFTQLWYPFALSDANPAGNITPDIGVHTLVKESGIMTQNGIVNMLTDSHTLFFYGTKK